ncbi:MAG: amino acid adenylation domain-containing protein [Christensenellaceae bacterium]|nr:amino acid adenylation domain-containing protein [Christensenellaceae bacterium]
MIQQNTQYALSHPQQRIWYAEMLHPGTGMWNNAGTLKIKGRLDFALLEQAVNVMLRDYETLRIRIGQKDGVPYQYVAEYVPQTIDVIDFTDRGVEKLFEWDSVQTQTPMPLLDSNLFYFAFLRLGEEEGGIYAKFHHIISDALSIIEFCNHLMGIYQDLLAGREPRHPAVRSYIEYLEEEKAYLESSRFQYDKEYWNKLFEELPEPTVIKQKKTSAHSLKAKRRTYVIRPRLSKQIRDYCEKTGVTIYSLFLAALAVYINRITTKKDLVIGAPVANRTSHHAKTMFGMFVSTVPMRVRVEDSMLFSEFVQEVSNSWFSALKHQKYPYNLLVQDLRQKHKGLDSLYDVTLSYQIGTFEKNADDFTYEGRWHFPGYQEPSLAIHVNDREAEGRFVVDYDYHTSLFSVREGEFIHVHFMNIIRDALLRPDTPLYMLDLMSDDEYERVVYQFNATETMFPKGETLADLWRKFYAQTDPEATAVICGGKSMTYRELDERSSALAQYLCSKGIGPEDVVGLLLRRTLDYPVCVLAVSKSGGAFLPIDSEIPPERVAYILKDSSAKVLLVSSELLPHHTVDESITVMPTDIELEPATCPETNCRPENLAYIIYTSGSTGQPKGVQIENRSIVHFVYSMLRIWDCRPGARMLGSSSISFDVSLMELLPTLISGNTLVLAQEHELAIPRNLVRLIKSTGVNMMTVTPGRMEQILADKQGASCLRDFREVGMGGDVVNEQLLSQVQQVTDARISDYYGPTEATIICTISDLTNAKSPNIGRPMHNVKAYILDKYMNPVPIGVPGELYIGGPGLARGYLGKPEMTAERFVPDPFRPGERVYRTGDLVRWYPLGEIEFLGRIDQQVKIRGYRIELAEIESRLLQVPGVTACAVAAREDAEGRKYLCAYLVGNPPPRAELKAHLLRDLPAYMVPSWFMTVDSLPYNTSGKVDRKRLPDPLEARETLIDDFEPPETPTEIALAEIWSNILNVKTIGRNDNFFDIGGDSLSIVRVLAQVQLRFSVEINLEDVNRSPLLKDFAAMIDAAEAQDYRPIKPVPIKEYYPVSSAQQRMWVLSQGEDAITYNMPAAFILPDETDEKRLGAAFEALIERHDALRTRFVMHNGELCQRVEKWVPFKLERISCEPRRLKTVLKSLIKPFDMGQAPLMRAALIDTGVKRLLYIDMHHSVCDARSVQVLMEELSALYEGKTLPPVTLQYKDYAVWQRESVDEGMLERQRDFWKTELSGELPVLNLHTDKPRPPQQRFEGARYAFDLPPKTTEALRTFAAQHGGTLFMAVLAVFNVLLSRYTGQEDIIVGTPVAGRTRPELQDMVGVFINTVPLRNYPRGDRSFSEFFRDLSRNAFAALANADYPLEHIVADLRLPRDLSRNPVFDVMLNQLRGETALPIPGAEPYPFDPGVSKLDLTLEVLERNGLFCQFEYNTRLFKKARIVRMAEHFCRLAEMLPAEPDKPIKDVTMLTQRELWQVTQGFNQTDLPLERERTVQSVFEEIAERFADKTAVICEGVPLSYRELNERANRFARLLREEGVGRNTVVALCMRRSADLMAALFGVLKAGGAYLPLDVSYPVERLAFMLSDSGTKILLADGSVNVPFEGKVLHVGDVPDSGPCGNLPAIDRPEDAAYVIYTSGSTGQPKGTALPRRGLLNLYEDTRRTIGFDPEQTSISVTTVAFDIFIGDAVLPLMNGSTLVLCTEEELRQAHLIAPLIDTYGVQYIQTTPTRMRVMMESAAFRAAAGRHIRKIVLGGEMVPVSLLKLLRKHIPGVRIINGYGPSEATVYASFKDLTYASFVTIGRPIANTRMYILDAYRRPVPVGVLGELYISGAGVASGYLGRETLTRARFVPDPFWPGHIMYQTGDVCAFREDGEIEMSGRADHQVKIRGLRIELGEIEAALRQVKGVREAVVKDWGEGAEKYLCAYYVAESDVTAAALREHLSAKLPVYMVPSFFVAMPALPTTLNGKVDRKALPEPDRTRPGARVEKGTMSAVEKKMARVWSRVLGVTNIGPECNFFELGGDSLGVIKVQAAILQYGWSISTRTFYEKQTLRGVCASLNTGGAASAPAAENAAKRTAAVPDYPHLKPPKMKNILLTGATGYLGALLAAELLKLPDVRLHCLVRAQNDAAAMRRFYDVRAYYFGLAAAPDSRISVLCGDIAQEGFGLGPRARRALEGVDTVIHCAALTDHVGHADMFDRVNVDGTKHAIALAKELDAALLHISTTSVAGTALADGSGEHSVFDEMSYDIGQNYADNDYVRSKFLAEGHVLDAMAGGLNARIFRVGNLTATTDGRFQMRPERNAFSNRLRTLCTLQSIPLRMLAMRVEMTPADACARAIIALSLISDDILPIYNVYNTNLLTGGELISLMEACGRRIRVVSDREFAAELSELSRRGRLDVLTGLMEELNPGYRPPTITVSAELTDRRLKKAGFEWPVIDGAYISRFMSIIEAVRAERRTES